MSNPLGDATRRRLTDAAVGRLAGDGFDITRPESRAEPPAIAVMNGDQRVVYEASNRANQNDTDGLAAAKLGIEPLTAADVTPTTVVSRVVHALERDRRALFVVADESVASSLRSILEEPPLLVDETDGHRTFYAGPDRIPVDTTGLRVDTGGYACIEASNPVGGASDPTFRWRETDTPIGPVPAVGGVDAGRVDEAGRPDVPRLVCEVDDRIRGVLAGVESLRTPPAAAFPYFYRRDPDDKRFRVRRGDDGAVVESVSGFTAMREAGFVPIPMPLVPEHAIGLGSGGNGERADAAERLREAWDLLVVDRAGR